MKQHVIIAKVYDHNSVTPRVFKKVCRSKSGAIKESRELNMMPLIRRYAIDEIRTHEGLSWKFKPISKVKRDQWGNLMAYATTSDCSVCIHVEDMDGNSVNVNYWGMCQDEQHLCETREECNCDKVWPELEARGFVEV